MQKIQEKLRAFIEAPIITKLITALILLNAITLGLETSASIMAAYGTALHLLDRTLIILFTLELLVKLLAYGRGFFKDGWNIFDLMVVSISWVPDSGALSVLRGLRVLRVLRLLSVVPQMRKVIEALFNSLPGMGSVLAVMVLLFYVSAVLSVKLFGGAQPEYFGDLPTALFTLFQIMTLEAWADGIVRPLLDSNPYAWLFFVPFILVASFAVLNLFIALIVSAMQDAHNAEPGGINHEVKQLREDLREIKAMLKNKESSQK